MTSRVDYFVTGTDTNVGKTLVSAALIHSLARNGLKVAGMKPVAAGAELRDGKLWNEDVALLSGEANVTLPTHLIAPYLFKEAAAPHVAAALEDQQINPDTIFTAFEQIRAQTEAVIVEGAGGFCVPLTPQIDLADIAARLQLDVILVVGLRLGCLNHAFLTAEAIAARGLRLAGWVVNQIDPAMPHQAANIEALRERLPAPCLGSLPWMSVPSAALAADKLDFSPLPHWPK
ncbi:MAG: dethiobiotin synthase [Burkholderiaceae bacterium]|jgi:dethiobiotin synthetase